MSATSSIRRYLIAASLGLGAVAGFAFIVFLVFSPLSIQQVLWTFRAGLSGSRFLPSVLILSIAFICFVGLFKSILEELGVLKKKEEWKDWRDERIEPAEVGEVPEGNYSMSRTSAKKRDHRLSATAEPWTQKSKLRSRRPSRAKKHWGYNRH